MNLRVALPDESAWINERYASVRFMPSDLTREIVVVAEIDGAPAGIGRLVPYGEVYELGGMLVFEEFRGRGVARALIDELLRRADRDVYCIPFADLTELYESAGFRPAAHAPDAILEKLAWCRRTYEREVVLLSSPSPRRAGRGD